MTHIPAQPYVEGRLFSRAVAEVDGKWKVKLHGEDVGTYASKAEALKAHRQALLDKLGDAAAVPTEAEIDQFLKVQDEAARAIRATRK